MESRLMYGKQTSVTRLRTGSFGERRSSLVALRSCLSQPVGHRTQGDVFIFLNIFLRIERRSVEEHPWNLASFKPWTWLGLIMASGRRLSRSLSLSSQKTNNICILYTVYVLLCAVSSWMNFCICAVYSHVGDFLRSTLFEFSWTFNIFEPARPTGLSCDAHGKHLLVRHPALVSQKLQIKTRRKASNNHTVAE